MFRISSSSRIVLGLVSLVVSALLMSGLLGLIPNVGTSAQKNRSAFCEATAVSFMALAPRMNEEQISETFDTIRSRDEDVESIAVRKEDDGSLVFSSGPHTSLWVTKGSTPQSSREFIVPISASGSRWGQLEVRFLEVEAGPLGNLMRTEFALSLFVGSALFVSFSIYLRKVLRHLNPSQVIPPHVREALDSLAEGLMVMVPTAASCWQTVHFRIIWGVRLKNSLGRMPVKWASDLSMRECYTLEIAALLHDIGKIGVPDAVLHKTGQLNEEEWAIMRWNRAVSRQLVKSSFGSEALTEIVEHYPVWFDLSNVPVNAQNHFKPTVAARILAIADAYDSMTSDASYRRRKSRAEAFDELRRCAGTQFDPELVGRIISAVRVRSGDRTELPGVSTDIALDIGQQIEQLVAALDDQDVGELRNLTMRLHSTADRAGIQHMANVADQLMESLDNEKDMIGIMQSANELLDLCRLTQVSLIQGETQRLTAI